MAMRKSESIKSRAQGLLVSRARIKLGLIVGYVSW